MVHVKSYELRKSSDGRPFVTLQLEGGLEMVQSQTTGKFYATVRKCSIPTTFDEVTAKSLIASSLPGSIERVASDPYEYTIKSTGEVVTLMHSYAYQPSGNTVSAAVHEQEVLVN